MTDTRPRKRSGLSVLLAIVLAGGACALRPKVISVESLLREMAVLARNGPTFRRGESEIVAAHRLVLTADMAVTDSYCADLMEEVDPSFSKGSRVQHQLDHAARLGLGEPDLTKVEQVRVA